jgi:hypothetical protein
MYYCVVTVEAGVWGMAGLSKEQELGTFELPEPPHPGQVLVLRDQEYLVVSVGDGTCRVRPRKVTLL